MRKRSGILRLSGYLETEHTSSGVERKCKKHSVLCINNDWGGGFVIKVSCMLLVRMKETWKNFI